MRHAEQLNWFIAAAACLWITPIIADEQLLPIAVSGNWATLEHRDSLTAPPDVCILMNPRQGVALRAASKGLEIRISDEKWSLPSNVAGAVQLKVGNVSKSLNIGGNTDTMVAADVSEPDILELFEAMDKAASMTVTVGKAKPMAVSLDGSSRAANAFRTCAGLAGNDKKGGENPFQ